MRREMAEALVRTGPETAMGRVMRRYWVPLLLHVLDTAAPRHP